LEDAVFAALAAKDATISDFLLSLDCPWNAERVRAIFIWPSRGIEWREWRDICEIVLKYKLPFSTCLEYSASAVSLLQIATDAGDWEFLEKVRAYNYTFEELKAPVNVAALRQISSRPLLSTFNLDWVTPAFAVDDGNQPLLEFACELRPAEVTLILTARAAARGNLDMLKWLHNDPRIGELHPGTAYHAHAKGHLDCKQYALENGCTLSDLDADAAELVNQLCTLPLTDPAMEAAPSSSTTTDPETPDE
jgi:hypothetical protein